MIKKPIHPVVHEQLTYILVRHFDAQPRQAATLASKLIKTLRTYDMDVIRGDWMEQQQQQRSSTWETLAQGAAELVSERNGIKPWNPPELQ